MDKGKVVINRLFNAPVDLVWEIWTQPRFVKRWFGSDPHGEVLSADIELAVGGKYIISFRDSDGSVHTAFGKYLEVEEQSRLRYTWEWESEKGYVSEVTVEFTPQENGETLLKFTHSNLNPSSAHGYWDGWNGTMDKIVTKIL